MAKEAKIIPFRNITECFLPTEKYEEGARKICSKKYQCPFFLNTVDRMFELYTSQDDERQMWVTCFNYLIKSTKEVQKIMSNNSKKFDQQIKEATNKANSPSERVRTIKQKSMKSQKLIQRAEVVENRQTR